MYQKMRHRFGDAAFFYCIKKTTGGAGGSKKL